MSKQVMEMALEALEWADNFHNEGEPVQVRIAEAIAALKEALKNQGEPVARVVIKTGDISFYLAEWLREPNDGDLLYTSAPTIPEGWQLVPIEPTEEMFVAGDQFMECTSSLGEAWEAMLSAAPKYKEEVITK